MGFNTKISIIFTLILCMCIVFPFSQQNVIKGEANPETQMVGVSTNPDHIQFYLYTNQNNRTQAELLKYNDINSINKSKYDSSKRLILYSSGFLQNYTTDQAIKDAYLSAGFASQANIIVVDWGELSGNKATIPTTGTAMYIGFLYSAAKDSIKIVGKRIQEFIIFLENNGKLSAGPQNVHLVGQSLGAHAVGMTGLYYQNQTGKKLGRITGTDPAGPLFQGIATGNRLDASDATFVDIVHTNAGGYGYSGAIGKADFIVNGGKAPQPGCGNGTDDFCSHNLAVVYYAKSILDTTIRGFSTKNEESKFGEYCLPTANGEYTVNTSPTY